MRCRHPLQAGLELPSGAGWPRPCSVRGQCQDLQQCLILPRPLGKSAP